MPDDDFDNDDLETEEGPNIRQLRQKAKKADTLEKELSSLRRENLIFRAGLTDLTDKQIAALAAVHDGDETPDAYRATAEELGYAKPKEPEVPTAETEALNRIDQATVASSPSGNVDHKEGMRLAFEKGGDAGLMEYMETLNLPTANTVA